VSSPLHSGYPGGPLTLMFAGFSALILVRQIRQVLRAKVTRKDPRAEIFVGIIALYLMLTAVWEVWVHSKGPT